MSRHRVVRSPRLVRKKHQKMERRVVLITALSLLVIGGCFYLFSRPEFRITSVEVSGQVRVSEDSVRANIAEEMQGSYFGIIPKTHTLLYPKSILKEALLDGFPALSAVSISLRNLHTLHVFVEERDPKALWCVTEEECFFIDETGFVFAPAPANTLRMYYRLLKEATTTPLRTVVIDPSRLAKLLSFLKRLEDLGFDPEEARLVNDKELRITVRGGLSLLLREADYDKAFANLEILLARNDVLPRSSGELKVTYIDLRFGNKIYFKPK